MGHCKDFVYLAGLKEKSCPPHTRPGTQPIELNSLKRVAVKQQSETDPDLPASVQESLLEAWVGGGLLHGSGH